MDIGDLLNNLSAEDISSLQEAAKSIFASEDSENEFEKSDNNSDNDTGFGSFSMPDAETIMKISKIMGMFNQKDSRSDFIAALKPYLSDPRKKRADEAMKFIKLIDLLPALQSKSGKDGIFGGLL